MASPVHKYNVMIGKRNETSKDKYTIKQIIVQDYASKSWYCTPCTPYISIKTRQKNPCS